MPDHDETSTDQRAAGDDPPDEAGELGYQQAVDELDAILVALDADDVDVDHLAASVRRAAELLAHCRARIEQARVEVERVVVQLQPDTESPSDERQTSER
jgi:exodeoxyribonuclease VII small subunit